MESLYNAKLKIHRANTHDVNIEPSLRADSWGLIIGDIVTNLRDSLDHIAWELAMLNVHKTKVKLIPSQERSVSFPLCLEENLWDSVGKRAIKHIWSPAHSEIERFQPYNKKNWSELNLLRNLQLLANIDKHRIVTPTNVRAKITLSPDDSGVIAILNESKESKFIANLDDRLELDINYEIAVYPDGVFRPMSIDELSHIYRFIRDTVIPVFTSFFK